MDTVEIWNFDPDLPEAFAGPDEEICEDEFMPFELAGSEVEFPANAFWEIYEGPIQISDDLDPNATVNDLGDLFDPDDVETSTLIWTVDNGVCGTSSDSVTYVLVDCIAIEIPDAFSPNGDGVNDVWEIPNLFKYPNNSLKIFNRWGALLYEASPYWENWDGRSHHGATIGTELPVSTYYYILDLGDGSEPITGWVYLKR
jgi:gliding motility-associated-like protein